MIDKSVTIEGTMDVNAIERMIQWLQIARESAGRDGRTVRLWAQAQDDGVMLMAVDSLLCMVKGEAERATIWDDGKHTRFIGVPEYV